METVAVAATGAAASWAPHSDDRERTGRAKAAKVETKAVMMEVLKEVARGRKGWDAGSLG